MKSEIQLLKEANEILRSVNSIIERKGKTTNWEGIDKKVKMALTEQHELLISKDCYKENSKNTECDYCGEQLNKDNTCPNPNCENYDC